MDDAVKVCSQSQFVTVWPVDPSNDWFDYHTFLLMMYKEMVKAKLKIAKNHIFSCTKSNRKDITKYTDSRPSNLRGRICFDYESQIWCRSARRAVPNRMMYKGVPDYKQVKLWKAYSVFIPKQLWNDVCPKPTEDLIKREEIDQKKRREEKKTKSNKRKTITVVTI
jgi:hypothetical protein